VSASRWRSLKGADRGRLREARLQAHYALQWLARLARAYVAPRPHDAHTNLGWDDALGGFTTHAMTNGAAAGLRLCDLTLMLGEAHGTPAAAFRLGGWRDSDIPEWLAYRLVIMGLDAAAFRAPAPYQMPEHPIAKGAAYAAGELAEALIELAAWFADAELVLARLQQRMAERDRDAPPVRCWPHHFDLDSLISLGGGATVGLGFCPGDDYYDEPYFYVSRYPPPDVSACPALPLAGHWHTRDFTAAIALARNVLKASDQEAECENFLQVAADILIGA
jgi:hypothetical protein